MFFQFIPLAKIIIAYKWSQCLSQPTICNLLNVRSRILDFLYLNKDDVNGHFVLHTLGIDLIHCQIGKYLSINDYISLTLVGKSTFRNLSHHPNHYKLLEKSLLKQNFEFTLSLFKKCPKLNKNIIFNTIKSNDGISNLKTPLENATFYGHIPLTHHLLNSKSITPSNSALQFASLNGHLGVVSRLLEDSRIDPAAVTNYAIRWASHNGHLKVVSRLLEDNRVDPSDYDNVAIRWAGRNGHLEVVCRLLEDERVEPSFAHDNAVLYAAANGHLEVVCRLMEDGRVDAANGGSYSLLLAKENGHLNIVERLLQDARVDPQVLH